MWLHHYSLEMYQKLQSPQVKVRTHTPTHTPLSPPVLQHCMAGCLTTDPSSYLHLFHYMLSGQLWCCLFCLSATEAPDQLWWGSVKYIDHVLDEHLYRFTLQAATLLNRIMSCNVGFPVKVCSDLKRWSWQSDRFYWVTRSENPLEEYFPPSSKTSGFQ